MTINELYKWAVKNGYENKKLVIYPPDLETVQDSYIQPYDTPIYEEDDDVVII